MLFGKTTREEGPFHAAGYTDYYLEGRDEEGFTPDIFAFDHTWYVVADVTYSPNKAPDEAAKYANSRLPKPVEELIAPSDKARTIAGAPFVLSTVVPKEPATKVNFLQTRPDYERSLHAIADAKLATAVGDWKGFQGPPPSFGVSAVPESTTVEVREALVGLLKWVGAQEKEVPVDELVEKLLGPLYTAFSQKGRGQLRKTVIDLLADVSKLDNTIRYDAENKVVKSTKDLIGRANRGKFAGTLLEWTGKTTTQVALQLGDASDDEQEGATDDEFELDTDE